MRAHRSAPIVVGNISDDLDMDYTALGDTVNPTARVEELAEPGTVYLSEHTCRAVQDYYPGLPLFGGVTPLAPMAWESSLPQSCLCPPQFLQRRSPPGGENAAPYP